MLVSLCSLESDMHHSANFQLGLYVDSLLNHMDYHVAQLRLPSNEAKIVLHTDLLLSTQYLLVTLTCSACLD